MREAAKAADCFCLVTSQLAVIYAETPVTAGIRKNQRYFFEIYPFLRSKTGGKTQNPLDFVQKGAKLE